MPTSATRILELKFLVNTTQFDAGIRRVVNTMAQLKQAMANLGNANIRISAGFKDTTKETKSLGNAIHETHKKTKSYFESTQGGLRIFGAGGVFTRAVAVARNYMLLYAFALGGVVAALKSSVVASVQYTNAMAGLGAIAKSTNNDVDDTTRAAQDLAAKGFMNVSEAAMGLKNLMATGFGLEDAIKIMKGFADSAAFNRQASFQWGESVVRATEGIRLGLSQVSDAAGITKNLSQILVEQGKSQQDVSRINSDASVRQALLNGLMKEFTLYTGNAELALSNYSGSVSVMSTALFNFRKEVGDGLINILGDLVKRFTSLIQEGTRWYKINKDIIAVKLKEYFGGVVEELIDLTKWLAQATASMVKFVGENKELILLTAGIITFFKGFKFASAASLFIADLIKKIIELAALTKAFGIAEVLTLFNPAKLIIAGLTAAVIALGVAFIALKKHQEAAKKTALENNAAEMRQVRLYEEQISNRRSIIQTELDNIKSRIQLEGATTYLVTEEQKLTTQLGILEGQAAATTLQIEKLALTQSRIEFGDVEKNIKSKKYISLGYSGYRPARAMGGSESVSKINPLGGLLNQLNPEGLYNQIMGTNGSDNAQWQKNVNMAEDALSKIRDFGISTYRDLSSEERKNFDKTKEFYEKMLVMSKNRIKVEVENSNTRKGLTEEELKKLRELQEKRLDFLNEMTDKVVKETMNEYDFKRYTLDAELADLRKKLGEMGLEWDKYEQVSILITEYGSAKRQNILREELKAMKAMKVEQPGIITLPKEKNRMETDVYDYVDDWTKRTKQLLEDIPQKTSQLSTNIANAYLSERENIKNTRDGELEDLKRQLNQGNIDTAEYMARRNQIMMNANIQMANATKNAWRQAGQSAFDMMGQMLSQYVTKVIQAKVLTSQTMGLGTGMALSGIAGLGIGLLTAGGYYLLSKQFAESPTVDYQSINPSTSESERKRYGSLSAAPTMYVNIVPTISFSDNGNVWIAAGSVDSFSDEVGAIIKQTVQQSINDNTLDLSGISPN